MKNINYRLKTAKNIKLEFQKDNIALQDIINRYKVPIEVNTFFDKILYCKKDDKYLSRLGEYEEISWLMKHLIQLEKSDFFESKIRKPLFKLVYDKDNKPICLITLINTNRLGGITSFKIVGVFDENRVIGWRYEYIDCNVFVMISDELKITALISTLEIKSNLRRGRGSLLINYLENTLINEIYKSYKNSYGNIIKNKVVIEGHIAPIGETSMEENISFYKSLGYIIKNKSFRKEVQAVEE